MSSGRLLSTERGLASCAMATASSSRTRRPATCCLRSCLWSQETAAPSSSSASTQVRASAHTIRITHTHTHIRKVVPLLALGRGRGTSIGEVLSVVVCVCGVVVLAAEITCLAQGARDLVSGAADGSVKLWDPVLGQQLDEHRPSVSARVTAVTFIGPLMVRGAATTLTYLTLHSHISTCTLYRQAQGLVPAR